MISYSNYKMIELEDENEKLKQKLSALRKKYNREKRWSRALLCVHFGDEVPPSIAKEFSTELKNL